MDILIIGGGLQALSVAHSLKKRGYVVIALMQVPLMSFRVQ